MPLSVGTLAAHAVSGCLKSQLSQIGWGKLHLVETVAPSRFPTETFAKPQI